MPDPVMGNPFIQMALSHVLGRVIDRQIGIDRSKAANTAIERLDAIQDQLRTLQAQMSQSKATVSRTETATTANAENAAPPARPYSEYAPWMTDVATSCVACGKGHLAAVQAALERVAENKAVGADHDPTYIKARNLLTDISAWAKEASRFARSDGMDHPEVTKRLERIQKEAPLLERMVLSPEHLEQLPPQDRAKLEQVLGQLRSVRQYSMVGVKKPEDLARLAADAGRAARSLWDDPWLHFADEELSALRAFDWNEERLAKAPAEERKVVAPLLDTTKELHEGLRGQLDRAKIKKMLVRVQEMRKELDQAISRQNKGEGSTTFHSVIHTDVDTRIPERLAGAYLEDLKQEGVASLLGSSQSTRKAFENLLRFGAARGVPIRIEALPTVVERGRTTGVILGAYYPDGNNIWLGPQALAEDPKDVDTLAEETAHSLLHSPGCNIYGPAIGPYEQQPAEREAKLASMIARLKAGVPFETDTGRRIDPAQVRVRIEQLERDLGPTMLRRVEWAADVMAQAMNGDIAGAVARSQQCPRDGGERYAGRTRTS